MPKFKVRVFSNFLRGNYVLDNWSKEVSDLRFGTRDVGGFGVCTFNVKLDFGSLNNIVEGVTQTPTYLTNRVRVEGERGGLCYEGKIYDLTLHYSGTVKARTMANLFTVAKRDYQAQPGNTPILQIGATADDTARALFGTRVLYNTADGTFSQNDSRIASLIARELADHKTPRQSAPKVYGSSGDELYLEVSCVGLSEELNVRTAWNRSAVLTDTGTTVKDMIRPGNITSGTNSGNGRNMWYERLTSSSANNIPYACQFIKNSFSFVSASGVLLPRDLAQGQSRMAIIEEISKYGSSGGKRMLFQVWEDKLNLGQGMPYFVEQPVVRGGEAGYSGYFDDSRSGQILDTNRQPLDLWNVRAGRWTTAVDVSGKAFLRVTDARDDPRMFWIRETMYDAESGTLTLTPADDFNAEQYLGELIKGQRVFRS